MTIASRSEDQTPRSEPHHNGLEEDKSTVEILRGLVAALKSCDQTKQSLRPAVTEN
ncbi:hypothetical protein [Acanthopleuribacter pedis]|uniref:Uncharacterized protein n=1 Tax=Acanthopleuribacter pedis TaxID=442870 RepID=A0A8J7QDZ8_9BACT|nr:hypothetical protein [Acanthopleuribacter pedis]MBO1322827.1 hypothetical protein [Acanthopleuribacter pedis]